jgi:hypothetical protein
VKQKQANSGSVSPQFVIQPGSSRMTNVPTAAASAPRVRVIPTEPTSPPPAKRTPPS